MASKLAKRVFKFQLFNPTVQYHKLVKEAQLYAENFAIIQRYLRMVNPSFVCAGGGEDGSPLNHFPKVPSAAKIFHSILLLRMGYV